MAAGGVLGFVYFAGVKYAGYTAAALVLRGKYQSSANPWRVGLARTGIGLAAGTLFGGVWLLMSSFFENKWSDPVAGTVFFGLLLPVRLAEWSLLIHFFFDKGLVQRAKDLKFAAIGSVWSFVLDAVGIFAAFVVPGGFWIC